MDQVTTGHLHRGGAAAAAGFGDYASLFKPRILALLILVAVATSIMSSAPEVPWGNVVLVAVAGGLASASASAMNNLMDRDIDGLMDRTRQRPLPRGKIGTGKAFALAIGFLLGGMALAVSINYLTAFFVLLGAFIYAVVYTRWLKRRTPFNIVIGGLAGSCAVLAGWAATAGKLSPASLIVALVLFLWTPSHFWSFALVHRDGYRSAGVPMLSTVTTPLRTAEYITINTILLIAASFALPLVMPVGALYLIGAGVLGALFLTCNTLTLRAPGGRAAWLGYKLSGFYLLGLLSLMLYDAVTLTVG